MEIQEILSLVQAVAENGLTELKLDDGEIKLSLKKEERAGEPGNGAAVQVYGTPGNGAAVQAYGIPGNGTAAPQAYGIPGNGVAAPQAYGIPGTGTGGLSGFPSDQIVTSPLVGTFYSSSSPEAEAFVKPGDTVKKGQVLGIIEAMKLMNEIESDYDGVVEAVLVKNEDVVEYGQPLFRIR